MVEGDWEPLRRVGLDDHGCLEVTHIVGIFNYLTRMADGMGLELDAPVHDASTTGDVLRR